jgi:hypothetical protein
VLRLQANDTLSIEGGDKEEGEGEDGTTREIFFHHETWYKEKRRHESKD